MALAAGTILEIESAGSDSTCSGGFNPANTNMPTDLTLVSGGNTSTPVVSSGSYNFGSLDIGNKLYVKVGTNWIPGWYPISNVGSNQATLNAAIGAAVLSANSRPAGLNTSVGCATSATAGGNTATWAVDYSQTANPPLQSNTLQVDGSSNVKVFDGTATFPTPAMVANLLTIGSSAPWTPGIYEIISYAAGSPNECTLDRSPAAAGTTAGSYGVGGAFATQGKAGSVMVSGNVAYMQKGSYSITSSSANVAGGVLSMPVSTTSFRVACIGYNTIRTDAPTTQSGNQPVVTHTVTGASTFQGTTASTENITVNCASESVSTAFATHLAINCLAKNAVFGFGSTCLIALYCGATGCSNTPFNGQIICVGCESWSNTATGFNAITGSNSFYFNCLSHDNSGASSFGFADTTTGSNSQYVNCTAYNNGADGFRRTSTAVANLGQWVNCISVNNGASGTGYGFNANAASDLQTAINCATYGNASGAFGPNVDGDRQIGSIVLTGVPFNNAGTADFSLNNVAGQGAACRAASYLSPLPDGTATYLDLGAAQSKAAGGAILSRAFLGMGVGV